MGWDGAELGPREHQEDFRFRPVFHRKWMKGCDLLWLTAGCLGLSQRSHVLGCQEQCGRAGRGDGGTQMSVWVSWTQWPFKEHDYNLEKS